MQTLRLSRKTLTVLTLVAALAVPMASASPSAIGRYKDWSVFTDTANGETICYAATQATDTNWKSGRARNQPSLKVGFDLREDLAPKASVGRSSWAMFGVGREAFADDSDDSRIVSALRKGSELRIEAVSQRNTQVAYHFSLSGSAAAIDKASAICR